MYIKNKIKAKDDDLQSVIKDIIKEEIPVVLRAMENKNGKLYKEVESFANETLPPYVEELRKLGYHASIKGCTIYVPKEEKTEQFKADYERLWNKYLHDLCNLLKS